MSPAELGSGFIGLLLGLCIGALVGAELAAHAQVQPPPVEDDGGAMECRAALAEARLYYLCQLSIRRGEAVEECTEFLQ